MPIIKYTKNGKVIVTEKAISNIVGNTTMGCYGVVGLIEPNSIDGIIKFLTRDTYSNGIKVKFDKVSVNIYLTVVLEYGISIATVTGNIINEIKYIVEKETGISVNKVDIFVHSVRID